jgi:hypothetical protein
MAEINFPKTPVNNQSFTVGSKTWIWKDSINAWVAAPAEDFNSLLRNLNTDIIPSIDSEYSLGSETKKWKDLYLSGNTVYLGNIALKDSGNGSLSILKLDGETFIPGNFDISFSDITGINYSNENEGQLLGIINGNFAWITPTDSFSNSDETDPTVPSHVKGITTTNISNWNTSYNWGDHAAAGYLLSSTASSTYQPIGTYATLTDGKLSDSVLPAIAITDTFVVASQSAMLALTAETGDVAIRTDINSTFILSASPASTLSNWKELLTPADGVQSVSGTAPISSTGGTNPTISINAASTSAAGSMSAFDKTKLNSIAANANNYLHPTGFSNQPASALTGASVISQVTVNTNGHVTAVSSRSLTPANIGAATTADYIGTITSGGWSGTGPFTKAVTVNGITSTDNPILDLNLSNVTFANVPATQTAWGKVYRGVTTTNTITFHSTEALTVAMPFTAKVVR